MDPIPDTQAPFAPRLVTGAAFKALVDPEVVLHTTLGDVLLELNTNLARTTVANMLAYVGDGFYDGTLFHRVIPGFMVQGGGLTSGLIVETPTYAPIPLESSNGLLNLRGALAMARTDAPDSATAQFFVNLVDNAFLNYASLASPGYTAFGQVVTGMSVIDGMATVPTASFPPYADVPVTDIVINTATQTLVGSSISNNGTFSVAGLEAGGRFEYSVDAGGHWSPGSGNGFTVPAGDYAANAIQVRQYDAAGNQSLAARFADALNVNATNNVTTNHAPTGSVRVTGIATLGQLLSANTATLSDADGAGTLGAPSFRWLKGGEFVPGATGSTYVLGAGDVGASISVRVTYTDALGRVENVLSTGTTLSGDAAGNVLTGSDYVDVLNGLDGNDTLFGGLGADSMVGGAGNDVYYVDNTLDQAVELPDGGIDEVRTSINYPTYQNAQTALAANVENITLLGTAGIYAIGNALANSMLGNPGANIFLGYGGNDTIDGGTGNDSIDGGSDNDSLTGGTGSDSLIGGLGNDILRGADNADTLRGGDGDDSLAGGKGVDSVDGGEGNDTLSGGVGNDILIGGNGVDRADYSLATDAVTVNLTIVGVAQMVSPLQASDTLTGIEYITGSNLADLLTGDLNANSLIGLSGDDTLVGNEGFDTMDGGDGNDLLAGGNNADWLIGGAGNDTLGGGKGMDTLDGGDGNDLLNGTLGQDQLTGGAGADMFLFNSLLDGMANVDTITDFARGVDFVQLSANIFGAFAGQVGQTLGTNENLGYDSTSGVLTYDSDGNGGNGPLAFAILGNATHPAALGFDFQIVA